MEIVSGRTGKPHVTSQQFRQLIEGTVGQESCILTSGENLEPELASNNSLKIRSGMLAHHGNISSVKIGTYDAVNLSNGSQGMKRIDLVVCRYTRNAETEVESCNWVVIMGTPVSSNPVAPTYTVGNLQEGDLVDDCPVFEVHYDGINVTEVRKILSVVPNLTELNSKIPHFYNGEIVLHYYSTTWLHAREFVGKEFAGCYPQATCLYREGQPNQQTTIISAMEVDSDGYLVIWAYGSGYVSGHMLGVSVSIRK